MVGNKNDLEEERVISFEQGKQYAKEKNLNFFAETSAKEGNYTKEIFMEAAKQLYLSPIDNCSLSGFKNNEISNMNNSTLLEAFDGRKNYKKKCC